jgi:uroporphyrinogen-III synthase
MRELEAQGYGPILAPMLRIKMLSSVELPNLLLFDTAIFISTNAVAAFGKALSQAKVALPLNISCFGIGAKTAQSLESIGVNALSVSGATTEALLTHSWFRQPRSVLIVKGEGGRATLANELKAMGSSVVEWEGYQRLPPSLAQCERFRSALTMSPIAILAQSGETLLNALNAVNAVDANNTKLSGSSASSKTRWIVPSERVAEIAREHGVDPLVAPSAADDDMVSTLNRYCQQQKVSHG